MTRKAARQTRPTLEELEPRILFSGDALFQDTTNDQLAAECIDYDLIEASCAKEKPSVHDEEKQELVIIDAGVEDIDRILADFSEQNQKHFELLVLDSNRDGISQITELLKQKSKLDVVHIISHGNNATLQLGNTQLDKESLQSHASAIARWSDALTADADILIYGCDVAADAEGKQLLNELALLTGADIAASTDLTGHSALGGDWDLEFSIGEINSDIAPSQHLQQSYAATLVNLTPDVELDNGNLSWQLNSLSTSRDGAHDVFAADIDGDGDIDIAGAADVDDSLVWYENDGNGNFIEHLITDSEDGVISVEVADMDNDGDMDMVSAGRFNDTVAVWINDGNQNFTRNVAASNINIAFSVHAIDVDGDGLKDIVFSENGESNTGVGGRLGWLEQNDNGTFTQHFIDTTVNAQVTNNVETTQGADIDGDGDIDIIAALDVDTDFVWYENDGSQNFTKHVFDNNANNALDIKAFDIDQDGDMDMAGVVFLDGTLYWYENDGSQNFTRHEVSNTLDQAQTVNIADIDGDGDYDLLTASSGSDQLRWYENDGSQNFTEHFISAGSDGGESAVAADLNGDNVLDLIFASRTDGQYSAYINPTKTVWTNIGDGSNERQLPIDLSVSDAEATDLIVSLSVSNGTLSIDDTLVTITDGANNSSSIEIEASISNLNSTLDTLIYESDLHYLGADTLDIEVQDNLDHATANPTDTVFIVLSSLPITVQAGNTLTVTTSSDIDDGNTSSIGALLTDMGADGEISLREAIIATNNTQNGDVVDRILFDLPNAELIDPGGSNHWEINLDSELPEITDAVTINALASGSTDVRISIKGDNAGTDANGFSISASDTSIRGLNIQGFDGAGIHIHAGSNQRLERNFIGTDITGENAAANNIGILLNGTAGSVTIGSDNRDLGNLVSGNTGDGIHIRDADANTIKSNLIGTNLAGDADLGNGGYGIHLRDASNNNIGANTAVRNIISGNGEGGLDITFDSSNNTVRGNFIGTDLTGTAAIGNTDDGITISDGADNNTIGGDRSNNEGNVLSGNSNDGIEIEHNGTDGNLIFGNYIGVDSSGESALANGRHGISLFNGISNTVVGGASDGRGNVIAGNSTNGIIIDGWTDSDTANNKIIGNFIGTDVGATLDLGNGDKGIRIFGQANNNQIGGINSNEGNIIANNTREGISISDDDADNNSILGNAIYNNGALDIDIGADGLSGNDNDDADSGANDGQNSAVIEDVTTVGANSSITGSLSSLASSNYIIEFFHSPANDANPIGAGGARNSLGRISVTTDASGQASFSHSVSAINSGNIVTAIVTEDLGSNTFGNSSEFSLNVSVVSNARPTLDTSGNMTLTTISEDDVNNTGDSVADIIASAGGDRITDVDGPAEGIAVTSATNNGSNGIWQFSDDSGLNWQNIENVADDNALLLRPQDRLRFLPDTVNGDTATIEFKAWDQSSGIAGTYEDASNATAFSSDTEEAGIVVNSVNDETPLSWTTPPTAMHYLEDKAMPLPSLNIMGDANSVLTLRIQLSEPGIGELLFTDGEGPADSGLLQLSASAAELNQLLANLRFNPAANENADLAMHFELSDGSDTLTATSQLKGIAINDKPEVLGENFIVYEGESTVLDLTQNDNDPDNDDLYIEIMEAPRHGSLYIDADGKVRYTSAGSPSGTDSFRYRLNDGTAVSETAEVTLMIEANPHLEEKPTPKSTISQAEQVQEEEQENTLTDAQFSQTEKQVTTAETGIEVAGITIDELFESLDTSYETRLDLFSDQRSPLGNIPLPELELWSAGPLEDRLSAFEASATLDVRLRPIDVDEIAQLFANFELWDLQNEDRPNREKEENQYIEYLFDDTGAIAASATISAGIVSWILRAGGLLGGFLSLLPAWKGLDPLPILSSTTKNQSLKDQKDSIRDDSGDSAEELFAVR